MATKIKSGIVAVLVLTCACVPSSIIGPLSYQREQRDQLRKRAMAAGTTPDVLDKVFLPLTPEEEQLARDEDASCRSSYMWKSGLTWGGSVLIGAAAGITIGAAYATSNNDTSGKLIFGVSAGTMAALGSVLVAIGGITQQRFTDRGCTSKRAP